MPGTETVERPEADAPQASYNRATVERIIASRMIAALLALLCLLAILAPSTSTIYQVVAFAPAALWLGFQGSQRLPASLQREATRPTRPVVLAAYAGMACIAGLLSFGTWHATSERDFSGFDRGAGWYTLVFAVVLALAAASLRQPNLMRPFDSALHVVALACGMVFIGAAVSGTFSQGMSLLRCAVVICGLAVFVVASKTITRRATDPLSTQGAHAAAFTAAGGLMAASSFMSWGAGGFIVNYRPGTSMGGFDGRITLWSGIAIAVVWVALFLSGTVDERRWRSATVGSAALGFAGLAAVVNSASGSAHPGRVLAASACVFVLAKAVVISSPDQADETGQLPTSASVLVGRFFAGSAALIGALLFMVGSARSQMFLFLRVGRAIDYDDAMALVTFAGLGLVLLRGALGVTARRELGALVAGIVLAGLTLILVIPPDRVSGRVLLSAALFAVPAAVGLMANKWIGPPTSSGAATRLARVMRHQWKHVLGAGIIAYVSLRWVIPEILERDPLGDDYTEAELVAWRERMEWMLAVRATILVTTMALITLGRQHLVRGLVATGIGAALYFATQDVTAASPILSDGEYGPILAASMSVLAVVFLTLGRGRHSVVAMAAVAAFTSPWFVQSLLMALPRAVWGLPGLGGVLRLLPETVHYAAIALVFLAFPFGGTAPRPAHAAPDTDDVDSHGPDREALVGSAHGTER